MTSESKSDSPDLHPPVPDPEPGSDAPSQSAITPASAPTPLSTGTEPEYLQPNLTGLPDALKLGIEHLSGVSLDAVRVHYSSPRPGAVGALAYAQGTEIHLAAGQEQLLGHEAWHIVQQLQGRVRPTPRIDGEPVNTDPALEREAHVMGAKALLPLTGPAPERLERRPPPGGSVIQSVNEKQQVEANGIAAVSGLAQTSNSKAGATKKPLAVVRGTMELVPGQIREVEAHVHLNANDPITTYSGANVRYQGEPVGFAYWPAGVVAGTAWLEKLLQLIPHWERRDTWTGADGGDAIAWMPPVDKGWRFIEAENARQRRENRDFKISYMGRFSDDLDKAVKDPEPGAPRTKRQQALRDILKDPLIGIETKKQRQAVAVTLIYPNEQAAFEQWDDARAAIESRWKTSDIKLDPTFKW